LLEKKIPERQIEEQNPEAMRAALQSGISPPDRLESITESDVVFVVCIGV
jgi:hypothetical protein